MVRQVFEYHISCDICERDGATDVEPPFGYGSIISNIGTRDTRKMAKLHEWIRKDNKDICPKCAKNYI
jgi:hypothetical protein